MSSPRRAATRASGDEMAGFAELTDLALGNGLLERDPKLARGLFVRDLDRTQQNRSRGRASAESGRALERQLAEKERTSGRRGFGHLQPDARIPRYSDRTGQSQYMLDAILKDQALATYDREAPLRRELARARP